MKRRRLLFVEILIVGLLFCLYSCSDQTVDQMNYTYEPGQNSPPYTPVLYNRSQSAVTNS